MPEHAGKPIYDGRACATCHNNPQQTRAPAFDALKAMRYGQLHYALTDGKMAAQGATLKPDERAVLIDYLVGRTVAEDGWIDKMMCAPNHRNVNLRVEPTVAGFGFDRQNHRNSVERAGGRCEGRFPQSRARVGACVSACNDGACAACRRATRYSCRLPKRRR